jgi:atypical dual specificity phosphatase
MGPWWIDKPTILGSSNPTSAELGNLYSEGFRTIISLLDEKQQPPNYDVREIERIGFKRYSIPIKDGTAPTLPKFKTFLKIIQASKDKILIHCQGGAGRTGTMAAAYWMKKGLSAKEAIEKVRKSCRQAVETPGQERSLHRLEAAMKGRNSILSRLVRRGFN